MAEICISYRHVTPDAELAEELAAFVRGQGVTCFIDTAIAVGRDWSDEIEGELRDCRSFVGLVSATWADSRMVWKEVELAQAWGKRIVPVRVDFEDPLPYALGATLDPLQHRIWRRGEDFAPLCRAVLNAHRDGAEDRTGYWSPMDRFRLKLERLGPVEETEFDPDRLDFLLARNRAVPVVGREGDLAELRKWLEGPADVSVRLVTGGAGAGKTRLAIQAMEDLAGSGWDAGFVRPEDVAEQKGRHWNRPTLAVVDHAAAVTEPLKAWLGELAGRRSQTPLRILLLEREADAGSGWLKFLFDGTSTGEGIRKMFDPPGPVRVTPLAAVGLRRTVLEAALAKLGAKALLPVLGTDAGFEARLGEPLWEDPLYLLMAALVGFAEGGVVRALSLSRAELALRLAGRELGRIRKFLPAGVPDAAGGLLERLAGVVTACRSLERPGLVVAAKEEGELLGFELPGGAGVAAELVLRAMRREGKASAIEPGIVGEAALVRVFGGLAEGAEAKEGAKALVRAGRREDGRFAGNVCFAITRTCQDFVNDACQGPLEWVEAFIESGAREDVRLLLALEGQMPVKTLVLRERAARVDGLLLERFRGLMEAGSGGDRARVEYARIANNLAVRLRDLGRREEALGQAEEAVRSRRDLAQTGTKAQRPDAFLPDLAMSLNNLAKMLSDLGRREEALGPVEEAVRVRRDLARTGAQEQRPDAFLAGLAVSLNNLSVMLSDLGRWEEALGQSEEAVCILGDLVRTGTQEQRPDAFLPDLATSLNNLAYRLSDLGRREEALGQAEEAVRICRDLARARPDAFLPDLAMSLDNLANRLSDLGRREEALAQAEEAVRIYGNLARARPDTFLPDLARALNNLTESLSDLGRREEALRQAEEAVRIYGDLARARPDAFLSSQASSLNNLANRLSDLGRTEEALAQAEEAVRIYGNLARARPDTFLPDLARALSNLATILWGLGLNDLGRFEEALGRAEEAIRLYRDLARARPDAVLPDLARSLSNLAAMLGGLGLNDPGRRREALGQAEEAVRIYGDLARARPDAFLPDLARSLSTLGRILVTDRPREAADSFAEAIRTLTPFCARLPDGHLPRLMAMCREYLQAAEAGGVELDMELLEPVMSMAEKSRAASA